MAFSTILPVIVFLLWAGSASVSRADDDNAWCDVKTCKRDDIGVTPEDHTWCGRSKITWHPKNCGEIQYDYSKVSPKDQQMIVNMHNTLRRRVAKGDETRGYYLGNQPAAANMRELVWNDDLAKLAETWAKQCGMTLSHDKCRDLYEFTVGQNGHMYKSSVLSPIDWRRAINAWYKEVDYVTTDDVKEFSGDKVINGQKTAIGHYTQLVWGETTMVGCAVATYKPRGSKEYISKYFCNYGPSGNYLEQKIYKRGKAGSSCPKGTWNNDGLCSSRYSN